MHHHHHHPLLVHIRSLNNPKLLFEIEEYMTNVGNTLEGLMRVIRDQKNQITSLQADNAQLSGNTLDAQDQASLNDAQQLLAQYPDASAVSSGGSTSPSVSFGPGSVSVGSASVGSASIGSASIGSIPQQITPPTP